MPPVGAVAPRPETADPAALPEAGVQVSPGGRASRESWNRRRLLFQTVPLACLAGGAAMVLLSAAIYLGSDRLRNFDPALIGYATATVFLAFGVTYRFVLWVANPPARRYFLQGWKASLRWRTLARSPTLVPRTLASTLFFQSFIRRRGVQRWLAHQAMFWGVLLAAGVTFPLTFGWIHFRATPGTQHDYGLYLLGVRAFTFDAFNWLGWLFFHMLDIAAVLVIAGGAYFLLHRVRERRVLADQRFLRDLLPLLALLAVALTGLLLTFSTAVLGGRYYHFLALVHMSSVVLTLLFIPFGKFFHVIHRTASIGVPVYQATSLAGSGVFECRRCGAPLETVAFVEDLQKTMGELQLGYPAWIESCPRCKRLERGAAYRSLVKAGFQ